MYSMLSARKIHHRSFQFLTMAPRLVSGPCFTIPTGPGR